MNHIEVFSELTSGKLKNMLSGNLPYKDVLSIVRKVNTKMIYENVPLSKVNMHSESFNFHALGYRSHDDFTITTTTSKTSEFVNISVTPLCYYELDEKFNLAPAPDKRSKIILGLLKDEFERIKYRALYILESSTDENQVTFYAKKNIMFVKTCFHNHKLLFHDLFTLHPDYIHDSDAYIHYNINYFLIKLRLFYEKLFEYFLGSGRKTEKQLLAELFQLNTTLLYQQNTQTTSVSEPEPVMVSSEPVLQSYAADTSLAMAYETIGKAHNISADKICQLVSIIGKVKWTSNRNILGDAVYQIMQKKDNRGLPMLEATPDVISSLISLICIDSVGHPLSKHTIKTFLQSGKSDKRPKKGSSGKIDIL